jgi:hypothetical protein
MMNLFLSVRRFHYSGWPRNNHCEKVGRNHGRREFV